MDHGLPRGGYSRPRAATVAECRYEPPKPPARKPTSPPSSPPALVLPQPCAEDVLTIGRQNRSYSVGFLERSRVRAFSIVQESSDRLSMNEEDPSESPRQVSTADNFSIGLHEEDSFVLVEDESGSPGHPSMLDFQQSSYQIEEGEFPASPVLRNCLQQLTEQRIMSQASSPQRSAS